MKKLLLFAATATMFAACSKDTTHDLAIDRPIDKLYVSIGDDDSRVQLDENCRTVWTEGDHVSVFNKTTDNRRYKFTGQTGDRNGELSYMNGGTTGSAIDKIIAVYPYNSATSVTTNGTISTTISANQTYCKYSYGIGNNVMIAHSKTEDLSFRNIMGWIRIALTGDKIVKTITLRGYNNESLAGNITITENLNIVFTNNTTDTITLDCGNGIQLTDMPTYFYIAVVPQTFNKGFCADIVSTDNDMTTLATSKSVTIKRNHIITMAKSQFQSQTAPLPNQIWYTTGYDGQIITPTRYDGNIVSNTVSGYNGVITFDRAQTKIGRSAFYNCEYLISITIPDSVKSIDNEAFCNCEYLRSITIPNSVTSIGECVFTNCIRLKDITIPNSIKSIGRGAFYGCTRLTSITIPNNVTSIGDSAFYGCTGLTNITIPDNVTSIGDSAFKKCTGLTSAKIGNGITSISDYAFEDCDNLAYVTIGNKVLSIGSYAFGYCKGLTSVDIPDSVISIHPCAFNDCKNLTSITIGNKVTEIGTRAFYNCIGLTNITIPDSVTTIEEKAFSFCTKLTSITIPNRIKSISNYTFKGCSSLTSVNIPNNVTSIGNSAFADCRSLTSVTIPDSVTSIGGYAFSGCNNLNAVYITDIAKWCEIKFNDYDSNPLYYANNLYLNGELVTDLVIPYGIWKIGDYTFYGCSNLMSVTFPDSVTTIGDYTFYGCSNLTSVTFPGSVTTIGDSAFSKCSSLTSITISYRVTTIGDYAFSNCSNITSIYCKAKTPPTIRDNTFYNVSPYSCIIYVPTGCKWNYDSADGWKEFRKIKEIEF